MFSPLSIFILSYTIQGCIVNFISRHYNWLFDYLSLYTAIFWYYPGAATSRGKDTKLSTALQQNSLAGVFYEFKICDIVISIPIDKGVLRYEDE